MHPKSTTRHGHALDQHRASADIAAQLHIITDSDNLLEHVTQVSVDGDFLHRKLDLAVLHPVTTGTTRIVAGDHIQPLPHQLSDQQSTPHTLEQRLLAFIAMADKQVMYAAGVGGTGHTQLAPGIDRKSTRLNSSHSQI